LDARPFWFACGRNSGDLFVGKKGAKGLRS
jgi:hypothetical protein